MHCSLPFEMRRSMRRFGRSKISKKKRETRKRKCRSGHLSGNHICPSKYLDDRPTKRMRIFCFSLFYYWYSWNKGENTGNRFISFLFPPFLFAFLDRNKNNERNWIFLNWIKRRKCVFDVCKIMENRSIVIQ